MANANKTHCPKGHPYDEANTYVYKGMRRCRECSRQQNRERYELRRTQELGHEWSSWQPTSVQACAFCKKDFMPEYRHHRFCSRSCQRKQWRRTTGAVTGQQAVDATLCFVCEQPIVRKGSGGHPLRFCSKRCKATNQNASPNRRWNYVRSRYGLDREAHDRLLEAQGYRCAICRTEDPSSPHWNVDHDHETGAIRGLLCLTCNGGIGMLNDDPELLRAAAAYLEHAREIGETNGRTHDKSRIAGD